MDKSINLGECSLTWEQPELAQRRLDVLQRGLAFGGVTDEGTAVVVFGAIVDFYCHKAGLVVEIDVDVHDCSGNNKVVKNQSAVVGKIKILVKNTKSALVGRSFLLLRGLYRFIWHGGDEGT